MNPDQLKQGVIVRGSVLPEPVELIAFTTIGNADGGAFPCLFSFEEPGEQYEEFFSEEREEEDENELPRVAGVIDGMEDATRGHPPTCCASVMIIPALVVAAIALVLVVK